MKTVIIIIGALIALAGCALRMTEPQTDSVALVRSVQKAVVTVMTFNMDGEPTGIGSGFFVDSNGSLITSFHVLKDAYSANVKTHDGQMYPIQTVLASNESRDLIKVRVAVENHSIHWVRLSSGAPAVGEWIMVVGSPMGLEQTASEGIVSAVRELSPVGKIFQVSAPISPGSSGSPVVNRLGQVVGVVSFQSLLGQNLNFAVVGEAVVALKDSDREQTLAEWTYSLSNEKPRIARDLCHKGFEFYVQGEYKAALDYYREAVSRSPTDTAAWYGLGSCLMGLEQSDDALLAFRQAVASNPDQAEPHYYLGNYYAYLGQYENALSSYLKAVEIDPEFAPGFFSMAMVYAKIGAFEKEQKALMDLARLRPNNPAALYNIGINYAKMGRYEEALQAFQRSTAINSDFIPALFHMGLTYEALGQTDQAREAFKRVIRLDPDFSPAHYHLGLSYLSVGQRDRALGQYKILKRLDHEKADDLFDHIYN